MDQHHGQFITPGGFQPTITVSSISVSKLNVKLTFRLIRMLVDAGAKKDSRCWRFRSSRTYKNKMCLNYWRRLCRRRLFFYFFYFNPKQLTVFDNRRICSVFGEMITLNVDTMWKRSVFPRANRRESFCNLSDAQYLPKLVINKIVATIRN
jgi:hypothetical protein